MLIYGCGNKNTGNIPTLEEVSMMSGEEATDCLKGCSKEELIDVWGEPAVWHMGVIGDRWITGDYGKEVTVLYSFTLEEYLVESVNITWDVYTMDLYESDHGVDHFLKLLGEYDTGYEDDICYNVTWDELSGQFGFEVFKFEKSRAGFLLYDKDIYELEGGFGFEGITYLAVADLNGDGYSELYYTFVAGSGMPYAGVGCFDTATKESTKFTITEDHRDIMLCMKGISDNSIGIYKAEFDVESPVRIRLKSYDEEEIAEIRCIDGEIIFEEITGREGNP